MKNTTLGARALCLLAAALLIYCATPRQPQSTTGVSPEATASGDGVPAPGSSDAFAELQQRLAEAKRLEEQQEEQDKAEYQRCLAQEGQAACASARTRLLVGWMNRIVARIKRSWIQPPSGHGKACVLQVTQGPDGHVSDVSFGPCDGDEPLRSSLLAAIYRALPLPPAPDPSLFDAHLTLNIVP
jgi:TolA protein